MDRRLTEQQQRELADQERDDVVVESATAIEPRRLHQMISVRLDPDIAAALRDLANQRGISVSDLLREGAATVLASARPTVQVTNVRIGVEVGKPRRQVWDPRANPTGTAGTWAEADPSVTAA
jgi:hypothetical protein